MAVYKLAGIDPLFQQESLPSEDEIRVLPSELVDAFLEATRRADYNQMLTLADQADKHDECLGRRLGQLVKSFDYLTLQQILAPGKPGT